MGKAFIPGSRDWLNGAARMRMSDRSMATTFFRPDRTLGIWAIYEPIENLFYRVMIGNGYNTSDLRPDEIDNEFVYSASSWINLGDYGLGYSDLECHTTPVAQLGHSFTFAAAAGRDQFGNPLQEENSFRLSDGTRLTANGALAPGVTVDQLEVYMYSVDAAFKYLGCSFNSEYFFRWIDDLSGNGPLPITGYFEHGFYAEGGFFILPKKVELNARVSKIFGAYGDAEEYALGINYFIDSTHNWKFTIDACLLEHSPVNNTGINHRAGDDGLLIRSQLQAAF
jgi:hypothetical protein